MSSDLGFVSLPYRVDLYIIPQRVFNVNTFFQVFCKFFDAFFASHVHAKQHLKNGLRRFHQRKPQQCFYSSLLYNQYSLAPAGMCGSTCRRCSFSAPSSLWTALSSIPQDSMPIILRGGRFTMAIKVLPSSSSGS